MSCGSPMPRGERIAKPAEWGNPFGRFFSFAVGWSMEGWAAEHAVNAASSRTPLDQCLLPPAHRVAQNLEPSMRTRLAVVALAAALSTACGEGPLVPTTGAIRIALTTTGADPDADGYAVTLDGTAPRTVGVNATLVLRDLGTGSHSVALAGLAANCTASGENPRGVTVRAGDTVQVAFAVVCVAITATIEITAATSGTDVDPDGYTVQVDAGTAQTLAVTGTIRFEGLQAGSHTVTLAGAATNCPVAADNPRTVSVTTGAVKRDTARTTFQVTCGAATGSIQVTAATAGIDLDPNGYAVQLDGASLRQLLGAGTVTFDGLAGGDHSVVLSGAAGNCTVAGDNPRTLHVITGGAARDTARTTFQVTCVALTGSVQVTAATSGVDVAPNGYTVLIDVGSLAPLPLNGATTIGGLTAGDHSVRLVGAPGNCTIAGENPRAVHVTAGGVTRDTARTTFAVTCVAVTGTVQVTARTAGIDLDTNGYTVRRGNGQQQPLAPNGAAVIEGVSGGDHTVILFGAATNCTITGDTPRTVHVTTGGTTRDTARTAFAVTCVHVEKIAFQRGRAVQDNPTINVAYADGSNTVSFAPGTGPTWSPDGTKLAFAALSCYDYYYYYCYPTGLAVGLVQLTSDPSDAEPAWSPDGTQIAFTSSRGGHPGLWVINAAGGSAPTLITDSPQSVSKPTRSPDGTKLAFTCSVVSGNNDICVMHANGTGFVRLTSDPAQDAGPAWNPHGSTIAFVTTRYSGRYELAVMSPDGTNVVPVSPGILASDPAWSPDGTKLLFADFASCVSGNCYSSGLLVMNADGTGMTRITSGPDYAPVWRP